MSNIQIDKSSGTGIAQSDPLDDGQALSDSKTAAEFASALARHKQDIRTPNGNLAQMNDLAFTGGGPKSLGNIVSEGIKSLDAGYKSKRDKLLKDLAKAGSDGNAMDVMKYTFELQRFP